MPGNPTLQEFLNLFEKKHGLEITMLSSGVSMLYSGFLPPKKREERLKMSMKELVESVSKKPVPPVSTTLILGKEGIIPSLCH